MWDTGRSTNIRMRKAAVNATLNAKNLLYMSIECLSNCLLALSTPLFNLTINYRRKMIKEDNSLIQFQRHQLIGGQQTYEEADWWYKEAGGQQLS
ncbi:hypothetical protein EB796_015360 [Bugula neritina]|uniref:Uncharacterized protein n=1 Tax=Bugula neritina TaxID=10212 RepID=A0A7J7JJ26_BUGNE|nr:hypothetical protein EB796_015360 [Bugula neritina]